MESGKYKNHYYFLFFYFFIFFIVVCKIELFLFVVVFVRPDGRLLLTPRSIQCAPTTLNSAAGSACIKLGETTVVCGLKLEVGKPFDIKPNDGRLGKQKQQRIYLYIFHNFIYEIKFYVNFLFSH
jgi:hypothetical protein